MEKALSCERNYDWKSATELYRTVLALLLESRDISKAAEIQEKIGFCIFKDAFQALTNLSFKALVRKASEAYKSALELYKETAYHEKNEKVKEAKAELAFINSWLESDSTKMSKLLNKWWSLKKEVLQDYEDKKNLLDVGRICNDLLEGSFQNRFHLFINWCDIIRESEDCLAIGEKSIEVLSKVRDQYQLARAYCWTSWYYSFSAAFRVSDDQIDELKQKSIDYSKKAVELSEEVGDAWLKGWSNHSSGFAAIVNDEDVYKFSVISRKESAITRDNRLLAETIMWASRLLSVGSRYSEDPYKRKEMLEKSLEYANEALEYYRIIQNPSTVVQVYSALVDTLTELALLETNFADRKAILKKAVDRGKEFLEENMNEITIAVHSLSIALYLLSKITVKTEEKKKVLQEALDYRLKYIEYLGETCPLHYFMQSKAQDHLASIRAELAKIETTKTKKIQLLRSAVSTMEKSLDFAGKDVIDHSGKWISASYGGSHFRFGEILIQLYTLTKEKKLLVRAIEASKEAAELFIKAELVTRAAESYWQNARTLGQLGKHAKAAENYQEAAEKYKQANQKIPKLYDFYKNYSLYMQAWSQIEKARHNHLLECYDDARAEYEKSAQLHEQSEPWSYLAPNYQAWARMEKAEDLSRNEKTEEARRVFQQACSLFSSAKDSIEAKVIEIKEPDEKSMASKLIGASDLRRRYCEVRVNIEEAKILDRKGDYNQSSDIYRTAAQNLKQIITQLETEEEKKELKLILTLCLAWERLSQAEEHASPETYLEAAQYFDEAKSHSSSKRTTQLAMGNSSFCRGLAAGTKFQTTLETTEHTIAKRHMEKAATFYFQAGYETASEYAKATLRLFDAYVYMNNAETELDPKKRAKCYVMAERLLQVSAGSFIKAKQPEKKAEVQKILERVKDERSLASTLNEVLHAPAIASSSASFEALGATSEESVGLKRFEHADIQSKIFLSIHEVRVGENVNVEIELLNTGKEAALVTEIENFVPKGFAIVKKPEIYRLENGNLNMKGKMIPPLRTEGVKIVLRPEGKGQFDLKPKVNFLDEFGNSRFSKSEPLVLKVKEIIEPDRIATGTKVLDCLLLGGIPNNYAIALTAPPSDERNKVVRNFLEIGNSNSQVTFYITTETKNIDKLLHDSQSNFHLFLCSPNRKIKLPDLPNLHRFYNKTDLNNLNIALVKAFRCVDQKKNPKRICIEIVSDVLLRYSVETTRRWISELITDLDAKGFTILAIMDPGMHPDDQSNAILNLFDGEISLYQKEDPFECKKFVRIRKLNNQDYIKNPICLTNF